MYSFTCVFFICKSTFTTTEEFSYFCILSNNLQNFYIHERAGLAAVSFIYPFQKRSMSGCLM